MLLYVCILPLIDIQGIVINNAAVSIFAYTSLVLVSKHICAINSKGGVVEFKVAVVSSLPAALLSMVSVTHVKPVGSVIQDRQKQMVLLLSIISQQQPSATSQCLGLSPHFISSCRILLSLIIHHKRKGEYSALRYFESERDYIDIAFITVYCENCFI